MSHAQFSGAAFVPSPARSLFREFKGQADTPTIEAITYDIYREYLQAMRDANAPQLVRMWNVIPNINHFEDGIETYQRFCRGRLKAFCEFGLDTAHYPAATAIGSKDDSYYFGFLASAEPVTLVSNPWQVEPFHYPLEHGPVPPSFARASVWNNTLYLSGTAAIRGHQSLFPGSVADQTKCALENLAIVIHNAEQKSGKAFDVKRGSWRLYIRDEKDAAAILPMIHEALGNDVAVIPADICRKELLMELEGAIRAT